MVEILDVGSEAETCLMAGRGMNGLRGTIVCFNESNQRYTLELESGEMMSLRQRNVVRVVVPGKDAAAPPPAPADDAPSRGQQEELNSVDDEKEKEEETTTTTTTQSASSSRPPSGLPRPKKLEPDEDDGSGRSRGREDARKALNWFDGFLISTATGIMDFFSTLSPTMILVVAVAVVWMHFGGSSTTKSGGNNNNHNHNRYSSSSGYHHHYYYDYAWSLPSISGMIAIATFAVIVYKFGTGNGQFRWDADRFWRRLQNMSFWEILQFGWLLEHVLRVLDNVGGYRRRRW